MNKFAPEYTTREKVILVVKALAIGLPIMAFFKYWLLPRLESFSAVAHCYDFGFFNGIELVFYGVFIGIPVSFCLLLVGMEGKRSYLIFKYKISPPLGYKVYKPTEYKTGNKVLIKPLLLMMTCLVFMMFALSGFNTVRHIVESEKTIALIAQKDSLVECTGL